MAGRVETRMTATEKDALWVQYKAGATCATIGRALGKHVSTIYSIVSSRGGIAPRRSVRQRTVSMRWSARPFRVDCRPVRRFGRWPGH